MKPRMDCEYVFDNGNITFTDEDLYQFVRRHSTIWDRLSPRKMVEMSQLGFAILQSKKGKDDDWWWLKTHDNWKFYNKGKNLKPIRELEVK